MLLCTFRLLKRFLCLIAQDLSLVMTAALVDYFPETEPELGSPGWDQHGHRVLQDKELMVGLVPYLGIRWGRSLLQGTAQGMVSGPVFSHLAPKCTFHPSLAAPWFCLNPVRDVSLSPNSQALLSGIIS